MLNLLNKKDDISSVLLCRITEEIHSGLTVISGRDTKPVVSDRYTSRACTGQSS